MFKEWLLTEIFVHKEDNDPDYLVAFRQNIWLFKWFDKKSEKVKERIMSTIRTEHPQGKDLPDYDLVSFLDYVPDSIYGHVDMKKRTLYLTSGGSVTTKPLLKKVVDVLKIRSVHRTVPRWDGSETEEKYSPKKITGNLPQTFYHGTSSRYFQGIYQLGIMPKPEQSNYAKQGIFHEDKVFVAVDRNEAEAHAFHTARLAGGIPLVVELTLPDLKRVLPDYDVDKDASRSTYAHTGRKFSYYSVPSERATKQAGLIAYPGRIPSKFIKAYYVHDGTKWQKLRSPQNYFNNLDL